MDIVKAKAPLRINFAGGGTDCEPYHNDYGSYILSACIKMYSTAIVGGQSAPHSPLEVLLSELGDRPVRIISDVPKTSGLGGSGSCLVAGLKALYPQLERVQLAQLGVYLEQKVMKNITGNQDHYCAAFGGMIFMVSEGNKVEITQLAIPSLLPRLLVLVYTGERINSGASIIENQMCSIKSLHNQKQLAKAMRDSLSDYNQFGKLLSEVWEVKKSCSTMVSNPEIDNLYQNGLKMGAIGGCLMGAGGGGYLLFMEAPDKEGELRANLVDQNIPYLNIEFDTEGVKSL